MTGINSIERNNQGQKIKSLLLLKSNVNYRQLNLICFISNKFK